MACQGAMPTNKQLHACFLLMLQKIIRCMNIFCKMSVRREANICFLCFGDVKGSMCVWGDVCGVCCA
jgi:hypothetical protein